MVQAVVKVKLWQIRTAKTVTRFLCSCSLRPHRAVNITFAVSGCVRSHKTFRGLACSQDVHCAKVATLLTGEKASRRHDAQICFLWQELILCVDILESGRGFSTFGPEPSHQSHCLAHTALTLTVTKGDVTCADSGISRKGRTAISTGNGSELPENLKKQMRRDGAQRGTAVADPGFT